MSEQEAPPPCAHLDMRCPWPWWKLKMCLHSCENSSDRVFFFFYKLFPVSNRQHNHFQSHLAHRCVPIRTLKFGANWTIYNEISMTSCFITNQIRIIQHQESLCIALWLKCWRYSVWCEIEMGLGVPTSHLLIQVLVYASVFVWSWLHSHSLAALQTAHWLRAGGSLGVRHMYIKFSSYRSNTILGLSCWKLIEGANVLFFIALFQYYKNNNSYKHNSIFLGPGSLMLWPYL